MHDTAEARCFPMLGLGAGYESNRNTMVIGFIIGHGWWVLCMCACRKPYNIIYHAWYMYHVMLVWHCTPILMQWHAKEYQFKFILNKNCLFQDYILYIVLYYTCSYTNNMTFTIICIGYTPRCITDFYHGKLCLVVFNTAARVPTLPFALPFRAVCIDEEHKSRSNVAVIERPR